MPFISVAPELLNKGFTGVQNKFITKYLPVLDGDAVKVYLYALYACANNRDCSAKEMADALSVPEDKIAGYFNYLEEYELVAVLSLNPLEIKILDADNVSGKPKKIRPEKYADFSKSVQQIIKGRMISTNEFREYFSLMEDYGLEQSALLMIINYCVNLRGDDIRFQYIKKVAKDFAESGANTASKVESRLSSCTASTPALMRIYSAAGIKKKPDWEDDRLYAKWTSDMGFDEKAICTAAKLFRTRTAEKLDSALGELYKNKKFDPKEIRDYCDKKNSVYNDTLAIARELGVYMQNASPYIENYVNKWYDLGYSSDSLKALANYAFKRGGGDFENLNSLVQSLCDGGIVTDESVREHLQKAEEDDKFIRHILSVCGLSRKIINSDRENLRRWRSWDFSDGMIERAAEMSCGKSNAPAYMNGILSVWKSENVTTPDKITDSARHTRQTEIPQTNIKAETERHYSELRHAAQERAELALKRATDDAVYGDIKKRLDELAITLAFAEARDPEKAEHVSREMERLEQIGDRRLAELKIDKSEFSPKYSCAQCGDTGYTPDGKMCACMSRFIKTLR